MTKPDSLGGFATELGDLLEREQELIAFDRLLSGDDDPSSGLVLIEGPPGIGKSRLIAELCVALRVPLWLSLYRQRSR